MEKKKAELAVLLLSLSLALFQINSFSPAGARISLSVDSPVAPNTITNINTVINEPKGKLAIKNVTTIIGNDLASLIYEGYEDVGFLDDDFQDWVPNKATVEKGDLTRVTLESDIWGSLDYNLPSDKCFNGFIYHYIVLWISEWTSSNLRFSVREAGGDWKHWATWEGELDPSKEPIVIDIAEKLDGSRIVNGFSFYNDGPIGTGFVVDYVMAVSTLKGEEEVARGKTAFADSIESEACNAAKAVDCDVGTRWASGHQVTNHWLAVDLGEEKAVSLVRIYWENAYTPTFLLQTSNDGDNWTTVQQFSVNGAGWQNYSLYSTVTSRYWRIYDDNPNDNPFPNLSIWELQLYTTLDEEQDEKPCRFVFNSPLGHVSFESASLTPLNSTATQFSWKIEFAESCPRGYLSLFVRYYNRDGEIAEISETSLLYLLGPSYGISEVESKLKVPHVAVVLWYQGWPVVDIRLITRAFNDTGIDMGRVGVAVDMGRLYPGSGVYDANYAANVTWLQENFPEIIYGCNLPTRLSDDPYTEAVDQLSWFYSVFGYYPKFVNQFGLGRETYQALEERGIRIVFSKCFEESSFNASDYRRYRGNERYGTAATCDEGGLWQPYKPSRRNEDIPGANATDQFDLWECGFLSRDLPHAYFDEPYFSNFPSDAFVVADGNVEATKEYLSRLLDMYELNAKWNDITVMHLSISSGTFSDPADQEAAAYRYLLHWEIAEMLRRGFVFVSIEELANLLDQFETTPTYKWVSSGTYTMMKGGGYMAEGIWKYGTFVAVGNGSGRAVFSVAADYDSEKGGHWIEVSNYTELSRYSAKWSSIRAPIGADPYFYPDGTPTGYPDDQFIPFYLASDGLFYYPNMQLFVLNTSVVVKNDAIYVEVWSTTPPDAPQCYFIEKITLIPGAIIYRVEAVKKENVGDSDIQVCLKGVANPSDNSPNPQVDSNIHIIDSSGNTYIASDTNPDIIMNSKPHMRGDAIFFYAYQNGKKVGAGIYLLTDCNKFYVADQPGSKGAVTYHLEGLKVPSNSKKTAPLEVVIVATDSLDSVMAAGQRIAQAYSGFYHGGKAVNCTRYTNGIVTALVNDVVYNSQYNSPKSLQVTVNLQELDISTDGQFTVVEDNGEVISIGISPVDGKITWNAQVGSLDLKVYRLRPHFNRPYIASHEMQFISEISASSNWLNTTLHVNKIAYSDIAYYYTSFSTTDWSTVRVTLNPGDFSEITLDAPYTDGSIDQSNIPFDSSEFPYLIFKVSSASVPEYRWSVCNGTGWYHWHWYSNLVGEHVVDMHGYGQIQKISLHIWGSPGDTLVLDYLKIVSDYPHSSAQVSVVSTNPSATYLLNTPYTSRETDQVGSYFVAKYDIPQRNWGSLTFQASFESWVGKLAVYSVTDHLTEARQIDDKKVFDIWISGTEGCGTITFYCGTLGEPQHYHNLTSLQYDSSRNIATGEYQLSSTLKITLSWEEVPTPSLLSPEANTHMDSEAEVLFTWLFSDQVAYQFQLSADLDFTTIIIDTGKISSTDQNTVQQLPQAEQKYYWRVKCWDEFSFESPWSESREIVVDRIKIVAGGVVDNMVDVDAGGKVWYQAVYAYNGTIFDDTCGILYINGLAMEWDGEKWVYSFPYSTEENQMVFHISSVVDDKYGLTRIDNIAGDIVIDWSTMTIILNKEQ